MRDRRTNPGGTISPVGSQVKGPQYREGTLMSFFRPLCCCCCCKVAAVLSDSVRPHRRQPTRLPRPWDSPGKNTGVGCHCLLQCIKVKSESEVAQSCLTLRDQMDCSLPGSSVHGIFQARVLEWGAIAFSLQTLIMADNFQVLSSSRSCSQPFCTCHLIQTSQQSLRQGL